jgi:glycosyltransferase involved in cell wall biosynthesis
MMVEKSNRPLVSIIVPVYNGARYLRESLDSILAQTYPNVEVLVMDDASTDETPNIIAAYGDRIRSYRQPQNQGIYGNMNGGIRQVSGEYIAIYHADDIYSPEIVAREVAFLEQYPESGGVFASDILINAQGEEWGRLTLPPEVRGEKPLDFRVIFNALLTYKNQFLRCPTCMVRASVYRDVGVYNDAVFRNTSDLEMYLRIARKYPLGIIEEYLLCYRQGHGNSSQRYHHLRTEPERFFPIMDLYLASGGREIAMPEALVAYEAHRAEAQLMAAINLYILNRLSEARPMLTQTSARYLLGSPRVQRGRLSILLVVMRMLVRLPRIPLLANVFYQRWHASRYRKVKFSFWVCLRNALTTPGVAVPRQGLQS